MTPLSTYRLQLHKGFRFSDAQKIIPYLKSLGIDTLYTSPILQAKLGSTHGYDVTDPLKINEELGGRPAFDALVKTLGEHNMKLLVDFVPNHMCLSPENPWLIDVLEHGPSSRFGKSLAIDWKKTDDPNHPTFVLPILGKPTIEALRNKEIVLSLGSNRITFSYYDWQLPLATRTYRKIFEKLPGVNTKEISELVLKIPSYTDIEKKEARLSLSNEFHELFKKMISEPASKKALLLLIESLNQDDKAREELLALQPYRLVFWKEGQVLRNYRRFFDIDQLIGVAVENEESFNLLHSLTFELIKKGQIQGLRIDHIDGLQKPTAYLKRLKFEMDKHAEGPSYIVVEKILSDDEKLPNDWPIAGTTGYEFLTEALDLSIDWDRIQKFSKIYHEAAPRRSSFAKVELVAKHQVVRSLFGAETDSLVKDLLELAKNSGLSYSKESLEEALLSVTIHLHVYRTYIERVGEVSPEDQKRIQEAFEGAARDPDRNNSEALSFLKNVFNFKLPENLKNSALNFILKWQQFTGPVMAKGHEDTALYRYNFLISLNEVGGNPGKRNFSLVHLHAFQSERAKKWPFTMNATSTHDTKRSEDVRNRIVVLSEIPELWEHHLQIWFGLNESKKESVNGAPAPSNNMELFIYQTLLGTWPFTGGPTEEYRERIKAYAIKAAKEAKVYTAWINPHTEYEKALCLFIDKILDPIVGRAFLSDFENFQKKIAFPGALNSLSQVVLKALAPGVPDFYQGSELWDFSLVDPDNRRPVDYSIRELALKNIEGKAAAELLQDWTNGHIKLWVTERLLNLRLARPELFLSGEYLPLTTQGPWKENIFAFAKRKGNDQVVVAIPRLIARDLDLEDTLLRKAPTSRWESTFLKMPEAQTPWHGLFGGQITAASEEIALKDLFKEFPIAVFSTFSL